MKTRLGAILLALVLAAGTLSAAEMLTVLTPDGTLYAINPAGAKARLELSRRRGEVRETLVVPGTAADDALESDGRILFDEQTSTLFVVWHKADSGKDSVVMASLNAEGVWSEPVVVANCASMRRAGIQTALTHTAADADTGLPATLIHIAWWGVGTDLTAEYAMVAFEGGQRVSTDIQKLNDLTGRGDTSADDFEDTGSPLHPPLAIATDGPNVDVVYGAPNTTKVVRAHIEPRLVKSEARLWRPSGRDGGRTGPSHLVANDSEALDAFISKGRVVLYRSGVQFRYVVLGNGEWSPERMIQLDDNLTSDQFLRELRRTVNEQAAVDQPAEQ
jgi:hypothetical protein